MGLVAAICTQCGASIQVDESKEAGICAHCGTAFITEKVINNYHIHNTTNVTNNIENANITMKTGDDEKDLFDKYRGFVYLGKKGDALSVAKEMMKRFPHRAITHFCQADITLTYIGAETDYDNYEKFDYEAVDKAIREFINAPDEVFIETAEKVRIHGLNLEYYYKDDDNTIFDDRLACDYYAYLRENKKSWWLRDCEEHMYEKIFDLEQFCAEPVKNLKTCNKFVYYSYFRYFGKFRNEESLLPQESLALPQKKAENHFSDAYTMLSENEKNKYADFIAEVERKRVAYAEIVRKAEQLYSYICDLKEKLVQNFREDRAEYQRKKACKKRKITAVILGVVIGVAAVVAIVIMNVV